VLIISLIGIILVVIGSFAGFYLTGPYSGYRYSCLYCEYSTPLDFIAQILIIILLVTQGIIGMNEVISEGFLAKINIFKVLKNYALYLSILTIIFSIVGIISFGATYGEYDWWPETGFYAGLISGLLNSILFFLENKSN
jgi:succinate dehydrogenase hydrophobic anchor subunit